MQPQHARAARVPLTFSLSAGARSDVVVPAGTQASTAATPGQEPVVFETARDFTASSATLALAFARQPEQDRFADRRAVLTAHADPPVPIFAADRLIEHLLYVGHSTFFATRLLDEIRVVFDIADAAADRPQTISWELVGGAGALGLAPIEDTTSGLTRSGRVVFRDVPAIDPSRIGPYDARWLRARLDTPIAAPTVVRSITLQRTHERASLRPDAAFANAAALDLTKDFLPLGDHPQFGDVFYLANADAFSLAQATVQLKVTLTEPAARLDPLRDGTLAGTAHVTWEFWNGTLWQELGTARATEDVKNEATDFSDTTRAFTRSGEVRFRFPVQPQPVSVAGATNYWVRARLSAGGYGESAQYVPAAAPADRSFVYKPSTLAPPSLKSIEVGYSLLDMAEAPEAIFAYNDFTLEEGTAAIRRLKQSFAVFRPTQERRAALYLGFQPAAGTGLPGHAITMYFSLAGEAHRSATNAASAASPVVVWEYWNGRWSRLATRDRTSALTCSGTIDTLLPSDMTVTREFGETAFWIRVLWRGQAGDVVSPLRRILLNTIDAVQSVTVRNEILGSSNGTSGQTFRLARGGVLDAPRLEVQGGDAAPDGGWVAWQEQADLHASGPTDRHYVLNHRTGEVVFGDGMFGLVPPAAVNNIRAARYQIGGGARGNVAAETVVQLKSAIPYVESVTNVEAATGGADAESVEEFKDRAPTTLRHQHRAVTAEDYEDLARLASSEVARARCYPLVDLAADSDGRQSRPGAVSVVVVPRSREAKPLPALELLNHVRDYLGARQSASAKLVVVGPEYVSIDVEAELVLTSLERVSEIEVLLKRTLADFLHPLYGGADGRGWDFGREPHRSDIYSRLGSVAGIDYVRLVRVTKREDRAGIADGERFLICPGSFTLWYFGV